MAELTELRSKVAHQRNYLRNSASNVTYIRKGNLNIYSPRICAVCGRHLAVYDDTARRYEAIFNHYRLDVKGLLTTNYCANSENCVSTLNAKKGAGVHGTI